MPTRRATRFAFALYLATGCAGSNNLPDGSPVVAAELGYDWLDGEWFTWFANVDPDLARDLSIPIARVYSANLRYPATWEGKGVVGRVTYNDLKCESVFVEWRTPDSDFHLFEATIDGSCQDFGVVHISPYSSGEATIQYSPVENVAPFGSEDPEFVVLRSIAEGLMLPRE